MSLPRKLPRRVGDILKFSKIVRLTKSRAEGVTQNSRFLLVSRRGNKGFWLLANPDTGKVYESVFRSTNLVKDVFMTKVYRASRGFYPLKPPSTKEQSE